MAVKEGLMAIMKASPDLILCDVNMQVGNPGFQRMKAWAAPAATSLTRQNSTV